MTHNNKDEHPKTRRSHHSLNKKNGYQPQPTCRHNHDSKDLEYDLTSQQRTSLNQTNDHLDVQVFVQIRVTRHPFQTQVSRHSQTRLITKQFSTNANKSEIAKHFGFWIRVFWIRVRLDFAEKDFIEADQ